MTFTCHLNSTALEKLLWAFFLMVLIYSIQILLRTKFSTNGGKYWFESRSSGPGLPVPITWQGLLMHISLTVAIGSLVLFHNCIQKLDLWLLAITIFGLVSTYIVVARKRLKPRK
jgi:hypothetical protein